MSSLKHWVWLATLPDLSPKLAHELLARFGAPEEIFFAPPEELSDLPAGIRAMIARHDTERAERVLARCEELYISTLTMQDALYPERLRNIHVPPLVLYIKGRLPVMDEEAALCVVGTREATPYGRSVTRKLCYQLARAGMLIVSGLAKGIDGEAHRAALDAGASTVAVLGCGVDVIYPRENAELYRDICASGAVVSEYPPGTEVNGRHFPIRNRIIAGLSLGALIVEGPRRSGSLITASHALEQGRDIFAVPGGIDAPNSDGPNSLIREGAILVSKPEHILEEYAALFPYKIQCGPDGTGSDRETPPERRGSQTSAAGQNTPAAVRDTVKEAARPAADEETPLDLSKALEGASPQRREILLICAGGARSMEDIVSGCGQDAAGVSAELTLMEIEGLVVQMPGKQFALNREALLPKQRELPAGGNTRE